MDIDFNYGLDKMSVVFDVGAYKGDFAALMRQKYGCGVHIFEPVRENFRNIVKRFEQDPMFWPYDVALCDKDQDDEPIYLQDNSSSLFGSAQEKELIRLRDIWKFIVGFKLDHIDLLKLNVEGSEYCILRRLMDNNWIENVNNFVIQFHPIQGENKEEWENELSKSHKVGHKCDHWQWWIKK